MPIKNFITIFSFSSNPYTGMKFFFDEENAANFDDYFTWQLLFASVFFLKTNLRR